MSNRAPDWLRQAEADLEHAQSAMEAEDFEWSCFASQQGAEKALKALFYHLHGDPWGHSLLSLMQRLPEPVRAEVTPNCLIQQKRSTNTTSQRVIRMASPKALPSTITRGTMPRTRFNMQNPFS